MANKAMWDWMDKAEGKKVGSSHANLEKEKVRQGYAKKMRKVPQSTKDMVTKSKVI